MVKNIQKVKNIYHKIIFYKKYFLNSYKYKILVYFISHSHCIDY